MKQTTLFICLALIGSVAIAFFLIPQVRSLGWFGLAFLACPLMHWWMMKDNHHRH